MMSLLKEKLQNSIILDSEYEIEFLGDSVESFSEKSFCFACGCFQGGITPGNKPK